MEAFLTRFQWDSAKFPLRQPLPNIIDGISKVCASQQVHRTCTYTKKMMSSDRAGQAKPSLVAYVNHLQWNL